VDLRLPEAVVVLTGGVLGNPFVGEVEPALLTFVPDDPMSVREFVSWIFGRFKLTGDLAPRVPFVGLVVKILVCDEGRLSVLFGMGIKGYLSVGVSFVVGRSPWADKTRERSTRLAPPENEDISLSDS
jgi:hypothetical protein